MVKQAAASHLPIETLRSQVDRVDLQLLALLSERARAVVTIGRVKKKLNIPIHVPERERAIFARLAKLNRGPFSEQAIFAIFREVISASLALETPLQVAFLGPETTFTHQAAVKHFGLSAAFLPVADIHGIFSMVEKGEAAYGVVPIENSTEGIVTHTLDRFYESDLQIIAEIRLKISHQLISRVASLKVVKKVFSHPHAFAQCRQWLFKNLPHATFHEVSSTGEGAARAAKHKGAAAIASRLAATKYQLNTLARHIEDFSFNLTRFMVVGRGQPGPTGRDKTSLLVVAKDEVGALYRLLAPIASAGINLTKIESRPLKQRPWEYMFFLDVDGHATDPLIASTLDAIKNHCSFFKLLGSYPVSLEPYST